MKITDNFFRRKRRDKNLEERLQKWIANQGILYRRKAEEAILQGKVTVNGKLVTELGTKVDGAKDIVTYDGKVIQKQEQKVYILLNKPIGYVTTVQDQFKRDTVMDLVKDCRCKVVPVGRLDKDTEGLLVLTNDGQLSHRVLSPKKHVPKTYYA